MIWRELLLERQASAEELRQAMVAAGLAADQGAVVVTDSMEVLERPQHVTVVCETWLRGGQFPLQVGIYLFDREPADAQAALALLVESLGTRGLTSDDSPNPFRMLLLSPGQPARIIDLDVQALEERDEYVLAQQGTSAMVNESSSSPAHTWASVVHEHAAPESRNDEILAILHDLDDGSGGDDAVLLMAADEALAALTLLRGVDACGGFFAKAARLMTSVGIELSDDAQRPADPVDLTFLALLEVARACGTKVELRGYSTAARCEALLHYPHHDDNQRALLALIALSNERADFARVALANPLRKLAPGAVADGALSWAAQLLLLIEHQVEAKVVEHHFDQLLAVFPRWLAADNAQFRQLIAAANVVLGNVLGTPRAQVGAVLHARVKALAAAASPS